MAARKVLAQLQVQHTHIPAHQSITHHKMNIRGRANDDRDTEANAFWKNEEDKGTKVASMKLSDEPWALWIGAEKISTQV
jgi:hypothetical protein